MPRYIDFGGSDALGQRNVLIRGPRREEIGMGERERETIMYARVFT